MTQDEFPVPGAELEHREMEEARRKGLLPSGKARAKWGREDYREWSDRVEARGYHRLAALFRRIADNWDLTPRRAS
jgi:hypothetical protein